MEKQLNSSGIFSQDLRHCRFFKRSRMICGNGTSKLKNSQTGSFLCQCSTTSSGQRKETMEFVFRIQKVKEYAKRVSQGHWTFLGPGDDKKWYGTLPCTPEGKWDSTATQNGGTLRRYRSSSIQEYERFESWNSEDEEWQRHHTLQCGCFKHWTLVPNLSIYGAVSNWCEQFGLSGEEKGQEKQKIICDQRFIDKCNITRSKTLGISSKAGIWKQFAGNIRDYESLSETIRFTRVCEDAVFTHRVSLVWATKPDLTRTTVLDRSFHYAENTRFRE